MMEKNYQLVAWTRNITDKENARLYVVPSVESDLHAPLIKELSECDKEQEKADGHISLKLARRFIRVYEKFARLDILTAHIDSAIRSLLKAADYCIYEDDLNWSYWDSDLGHYSHFCGELRHEFEDLCKRAIALAHKHKLDYVLEEAEPRQTIMLYLEHTQEGRDLDKQKNDF